MDSSNNERGARAVACSVLKLPNGKLRVVLDDVANQAPDNPGLWQHDVFVTFKDYEPSELSALELSEDEFAAFGHYVLARLLAISGLLSLNP
ncbi:hypothetical protein [Dyella nitratireducens]|uniref:Uncharacterized protein n=1 Tax=Dyella nitratireducens TaxID=1849580 RepID=A0ABQ1FUY1_9GAMM|nr:hypothetical protein [Dyella nitratireducens]GGA29497.1 hypothetical protein GCM10010981_18040 [Dyella nitratireducens]GLQ43131.1 hypothetical protein GCM10007902_29810 [Dyella nitratireducens]